MNKLKKIPKFNTEEEERIFWQEHDSAEYLDWSKAKLASLEYPYGLFLFFRVSRELWYKRQQGNKEITPEKMDLINYTVNAHFAGDKGPGYKYCAKEGVMGARGSLSIYKLKMRNTVWRLHAEPLIKIIDGKRMVVHELNHFHRDHSRH